MTSEGRLGWIGPTRDAALLRRAADFLLSLGVDQVVYLGNGTTLTRIVDEWVRELGGDGRGFLERVVGVAQDGTPDQIAELLESDRAIRTLVKLRTLPPVPSRAVEMLNGRIVLAVHDKKVLDEDDIANASVIVYGRSKEWLFKRFGPRYFLTPGPLEAGRVAVLEDDGEGHLNLIAYELASGEAVERETLQGASTRMTVAG